MKRIYPGVVHADRVSGRDEKQVFGISFPDFPGCISVGDTLDEAVAEGREALEFHIEGMQEDGEAIPEPSDLDRIDAENAYTIVLVPVDVSVETTKPVRVNVMLNSRLLDQIDSVAGNRSAFLAKAARRLLLKEGSV